MSEEKTPAIVADSIVNDNKNNSNISIFKMTIRRYAWLELLDSPFINPESQFNIANLLPTAYVMCISKEELKKYKTSDVEKLKEDAMDWGEQFSLKDMPDIVQAISKNLKDMNDAAPSESSAGNPKKN